MTRDPASVGAVAPPVLSGAVPVLDGAMPVHDGPVPVADGVARVHAVLDALDWGEVGVVTGRDVAEVDRAVARLGSVKLRLVAAAHRQEAGARAGLTGTAAWLAATTRSWGARAASEVALATALDEGMPATRQALADGALSTDHAAVIVGATSRLPETLTAAERELVEASLVSQARRLDPARLRRVARRALEAAQRSADETLRHEDAELRGEERRAAARVRLTMHDNNDGTVTGHFTIPALAGAILRKTIQQMVSPRRLRGRSDARDRPRTDASTGLEGSTATTAGAGTPITGTASRVRAERLPAATATLDTAEGHADDVDVYTPEFSCAATATAGVGGGTQEGSRAATAAAGAGGIPEDSCAATAAAPGGDEARPAESPGAGLSPMPADDRSRSWRDDPRDWAQKAGDAFVELLEHLPTDRLSGKVAATVVVSIDHDRLRESLGAAHLDTGQDISASEARRLACSAGVLPAVLGGASLPLDLGRTRRFFTEAQRVALATVYDECAAQGCDRPYSWTHLHHEDPWSRHGTTDLDRAVPLCGKDHRRAHDARYTTTVLTDPVTGRKAVRFRLRC